MTSLVTNSPEYKLVHKALAMDRGKAKEFDCIDCGEQASEWSWQHDTNPFILANYSPRCHRCHFVYDDCVVHFNGCGSHTSRNQGIANGRAKLTESQVLEIRNLRGYYTIRELAKMFNVSSSRISDIHTGKSWK